MVVLDLMKGIDLKTISDLEWMFWDLIVIKGKGYRYYLGEETKNYD